MFGYNGCYRCVAETEVTNWLEMASAATLSLWHKNWNHKERVFGLRSSVGILRFPMSQVIDQSWLIR